MPILIIAVCMLGWYLQDVLFLNWDVSSLLQSTRQMLEGGTYSDDFFIPSTPSILLLYAPVVMLNKWLGFNIILIYRAYIFLLTTISFFLCNYISKKLFSEDEQLIRKIFVITIAITFYLLPLYQLGQRDCMLYVLSFPYLLIVAERLKPELPGKLVTIITGMLAGIAITVKPQFCILPMFVEVYYLSRTKKWFACIRPETVTMFVVYALYLVVVMCFFQDYVYSVMPYLLKNYYHSVALPFDMMLRHPMVIIWILTMTYCFLRVRQANTNLIMILMISSLAFFIIFLSQRNWFLYHILPAFYMAIILLVMQMLTMAEKNRISTYDFVVSSLFMYVNLMYLLHLYLIQTEDTSLPIYFFSFLIGCSCFVVYVFSRQHEKTSYKLFFTVAYSIMFATVFLVLLNVFSIGAAYKKQVLTSLEKYVNKLPSHSTALFLSVPGNYAAPLMHYSNIEVVGRIDCFWMINGLVRIRAEKGDRTLRQYIRDNNDKYFFVNILANDLVKYKPDYIFLDVRNENSTYNGESVNFNIIDYFSENKEFAAEWQHYYYLSTIAAGSGYKYNYRLAVYQRNNV